MTATSIFALSAKFASLSRTLGVLAALNFAASLGRFSSAHRPFNALSVVTTSRQSSSHFIYYKKKIFPKERESEKEKYNNIIYVSCKLYYSGYNYYRIRNTLSEVL